MTRTVTTRTIAAALRRVKSLPQRIDHQHVLDACLAAGHRWRDGELNPLATITLFLIQVLHGFRRHQPSASSHAASLHRFGVLPGAHATAA